MVSPLLGRDGELQAVDEIVVGLTHALAFLGSTGVGKTAMLDALADRARAANVTVHRVHATPEAARITFGAVAHLLPDEVGDDRLTALRKTESALVATSGPSGAIVVVDDAHDLDPASIALVHALVTGGKVRVALAVDADRRVRPGLHRIWKDGHARRVDLPPLTREQSRRLLESLVGGRVADDVERRVWELAAGRPSLIAALAGAARFEELGGLLRLTNDPCAAPDVRALADPALAQLTPEARRALAALTFASGDGAELLDVVVGDDATALLESVGLARPDGQGLVATVPLFAAVALAELPTRDRRRLVGALADELWARGPTDGPDLVRAVSWRLEAGGDCEPAAITLAATTALAGGDYETAARLARISVERSSAPDDWEACFTLARALRQLGDHDGAEQAFASAAAGAPDPTSRVDVAVARAQNLGIGAGRVEDALVHLAAVRAEVHDPALVRRIAIEQTFLSALVGDLRLIADAAATVLDDPGIDAATAVAAATGRIFAATLLLRLDDVERTIRTHRGRAEEIAALFPLAVDQFDLMAVVVDVARGRVRDAVTVCEDRRTRGIDPGWGCGDGAWRAIETFARTFTCDRELGRHAQRAVVALRSNDPLGLRFVGRGFAAVALVHTGAIAEARHVWRSSRPRTEGDRRVGRLIDARIEAWELASVGDVDRAARLLAARFGEAEQFGHLLWGMLALHDAVRLDRADIVLDALTRLRAPDGSTGALLDAIADQATALVARDPVGLAAVARRFELMGADRFAAEALTRSGELFDAAGRAIEAHRAIGRAQMLTGRALPGPPWGPDVGPSLTDRQSEIVRLVLAGSTSREVAAHLALSTRTVDNHVAAVYRNLDLSSRSELATVLGPPE